MGARRCGDAWRVSRCNMCWVVGGSAALTCSSTGACGSLDRRPNTWWRSVGGSRAGPGCTDRGAGSRWWNRACRRPWPTSGPARARSASCRVRAARRRGLGDGRQRGRGRGRVAQRRRVCSHVCAHCARRRVVRSAGCLAARHAAARGSNPPYIAEDEVADLPDEVAEYEPRGALVSGPTGTEAIETLLELAPGWLAPRSSFVCEIAPHQADAMSERARARLFRGTRARRPHRAGPVLVARTG